MSARHRLHLCNLQKRYPLSLPRLRRRLLLAIEHMGGEAEKLPPEIELSLVTTGTISRVHKEFLDDPSPTDVITFHHGEILVCPAVAARQCAIGGLAFEEEVLLYGIHGLLHLAGHRDDTPRRRARMERRQMEILRASARVQIQFIPGLGS